MDILNPNSKAANSLIILLLIMKKLSTKDLCNESYLLFQMIFYLSFLFIPVLVFATFKKIDATYGEISRSNLNQNLVQEMREL